MEPLTRDDTATLLAIYGGQWSWKRRAVVLEAGGRRIAASMNGMPHGWGDIFDNDFRGHFCVHVAESRVHRTWRPDDGHQLMVLKAAGRLLDALIAADPEELVRMVLAAISHREGATLRFSLEGPGRPWDGPGDILADLLSEIRHLTVTGVRAAEVGSSRARVEASVIVYFHHPDRDAPHPPLLDVRLTRPSPRRPWSVDVDSLAPLLERGTRAQAPPLSGSS